MYDVFFSSTLIVCSLLLIWIIIWKIFASFWEKLKLYFDGNHVSFSRLIGGLSLKFWTKQALVWLFPRIKF